ncbi:MAG: NUDIX domain-containing protein [Candidatus Nanoarchaeia archaeon]|nr:NUDIX domain-containing protein [Candidatus Nanoarchaeia archaeon]MDD5741222.1 NUDIX domain-containing protein [Candidatus Nanoarchaeia archaeon]
MKKRIRIVAIIVKNNKLLLVKGSDKYKEYWTPGGKLEEGETELECLKRELNEELNVKLISAKFFKEYVAKSPYEKDVMTISRVYITNISGEIKAAEEIKNNVWMSKDEFNKNKYSLISTTREKIIPDLIKEGFF